MKLISGFLKFIAVLIMIAVVLTLPAALVLQAVGRLLFSPGRIVSLLDENVLDSDVLASILEYNIQQADTLGDEPGPYNQLYLTALKGLDHRQWVGLIDLIAPPELISQTLEQALWGYYDWIDNTAETPIMTVDLRPWKENLTRNFVPAVDMILGELRVCTPEELVTYSIEFLANLGGELPLCRPPEPFYSILLNEAGVQFPQQLAGTPNEMTMAGGFAQMEGVDWVQAKDNLQAIQGLMQGGWVIILIMYVIAIPMGTRSLPGVFKWAGWPAFLAGCSLLLIALAFVFIAGGIISAGAGQVLARSDLPPVLIKPLSHMVSGIFKFVGRPMLMQAGALVLFGIISVLVGKLLARRQPQTSKTISPPTYQSVPSTVQPDTAETLVEPAGEENVEIDLEEDDTPDEENRPSGMFG